MVHDDVTIWDMDNMTLGLFDGKMISIYLNAVPQANIVFKLILGRRGGDRATPNEKKTQALKKGAWL